MTAPARRQIGFTLIELMAAMSISIVFVYLLSETISATQAGGIRASELAGRTQQQARAVLILERTLANLQPPVPGGGEHAITASDNRLEFTTLPPQSHGELGPMRAKLWVVAPGSSQVEIALALSPTRRSEDLPAADTTTLLSGLSSAQFIYHYAQPQPSQEQQARGEALPQLITVRWTYAGSSDTHEVSVRPRLDISGRCHVELTTGTCRVQ